MSRSFVKGSLVYLIGGSINAAIPMVLLPVLTRYLTPTDYGIVGTSVVLIQIFTVVLGLNAYGLIGRSHFDDDADARRRLVSTNIMLAFLLAIALIVFLVPTAGLVEHITKFPATWMSVLVVISLCAVIQNIYFNLIQARQETVLYSGTQIASTAINLGLSLLLVVAIGMDWTGRMLAILVSGAVIAVVALHGLTVRFKLFRPAIDKKSLQALLSFGVPLIPHFIGGWVMTMVPRLYLNNMASVADTGLFSVGFNVASPVAMVVGAANQAYWPALFQKLSQSSLDKRRLAKILLTGVMILPLMAVAYSGVAYWFLPVLVGCNFYGAGEYIVWFSLSFSMYGVYAVFANLVVYTKNTSVMAWRADFLGGAVNLVLCPLMILWNGPIGAAQATFVAYTASAAGCFVASTKVLPMPWQEAFYSLLGRDRSDQ